MEKVEEDTRRNRWLDAEQAVEYGLVSKILKSKKELK
jgi:ATP-dependent Clp protease protease subunit